ncbi:hypothetical protein FHR59_000213 [Xanthomonas arboricola]|uniref:hypothetical protein n=1 Tax=Xanthomonas arboricola TaxID=56448 RepID=UPI00160F6D1E|nr:hypothetical protein [Xanthomonas arboricola]MBB6336003.1 hypothetical protein [Xanthomonas arboricola]
MQNNSRYLKDAKSHISLAAPAIVKGATNDQRFQAVVLVAIGIEKLLKNIIAEVNPALILKSQDFDSVVLHCHREAITATDRVVDMEKKASPDVITLKASIQRASLFSKSVKDNAQFIHTLADFRDIALHRSSEELDAVRVDRLLCRDLHNVIRDISADLSLSTRDFLGEHSTRLEALSEELIAHDNFQTSMEALLERHRNIWKERSKNATTVSHAEKVTNAYLTKRSETTDCPCPACGNLAVATLEPDYDYDYDPDDGTTVGYISGIYVISIQCLYCSLKIEEYDQLKYVDADALLEAGHE